MTISATVASLATALAPHAPDDLQSFIATLIEMPDYVARARLDLWEAQLLRAPAPGSTPAHKAASEIAALGRFNMYGAIDDGETPAYLHRALAALVAAGVTAPAADFDLSDW